MERKEVYKRMLSANIAWGLGKSSCHNLDVSNVVTNPPTTNPDLGKGHYVITIDPSTGTISVAPDNTE